MTATKDLALTRAAAELPDIQDCLLMEDKPDEWWCEWPREDADFASFFGSGKTPALAYSAMLDKLTEALAEKRMRDEDGERMNEAMAAHRDRGL